ncbi:MAG: hypothetical protein AAF990_21845 [Bacteroidota bacterium]
MKDPIDDDMMKDEQNSYEFFRNFMNTAEAEGFANLLDEHDIPYKMETTGTVIDSAIVGRGLVPKAIVKILPRDFKRVNRIIADQLKSVSFEEVDDHYLNQLDTEELKEIFAKQDEWSMEDISIAKVILRERGVVIGEEELQKLRTERFDSLRQGKRGNRTWMLFYGLGMILGLFVSLIFVIAGVGMSYYYAYGRSTDPDGERHFVFDESTRDIGVFMFYGGIAMMVMEVIFLEYIFS